MNRTIRCPHGFDVAARICPECHPELIIDESRERRQERPKQKATPPGRGKRYRHAGLALTLRGWAARTGMNIELLRSRVQRFGWNIGEALTVAPHKRRTAPISHRHDRGQLCPFCNRWLPRKQMAGGTCYECREKENACTQ